jgi:hypothetical protein
VLECGLTPFHKSCLLEQTQSISQIRTKGNIDLSGKKKILARLGSPSQPCLVSD